MNDNWNDWLAKSEVSDIDEGLLRDLRLKDSKTLLWLGHYCGWQITRGPGGFVILTSADGQRMEVPNHDSLNAKVFKSRVRKILRHRSENIPVLAMMGQIISSLKLDSSHAQILNHLATEVQAVAIVNGDSQSQPESVSPAESGGSESEPAPAVIGRRKRRITVEEPWSAHKGTTKEGVSTTYPSNAVMERRWNDNTKDYACRWEGCSFTHEIPRTVASHFAAHRRGEGTAPRPAIDGIDPDYTPAKQARIRRLRSEVDGALQAAFDQGIDFNVVDQAEWIATWIIDHRVVPLRPGLEEDPTEEMTAEEALDKIASIADRGRSPILREQIDTLQSQVEGFIEHVETVEAAQAEAEARAKQAEDDLGALRDIVIGMSPRPAPTEDTPSDG